MYGQSSGSHWESTPSWRTGKNGPMNKRNSIMPENYEEFVSLTLRTRNSKKPLRMLGRNWKRRWLLLCLARQARRVSMRDPKQNQWTCVHPGSQWIHKTAYGRLSTESSWGSYCRKGGEIHCNFIIWFTYLFLCLGFEDSRSKSSSG